MKESILRIYFFLVKILFGKEKETKQRINQRIRRNAKIVQTIGPEAITIFQKICWQHDVRYWPFWGTLLGAYREKGFIKHDEDIDIGMFDQDISVTLVDDMIAHGFRVIMAVVDKDLKKGFHLAFDYKGLKFDIYSCHKTDGEIVVFSPEPYNYAKFGQSPRNDIMDIVHTHIDSWADLLEVPFEQITMTIPANTETILQQLYGKDFMTPIKNKKADDLPNPSIVHEDCREHYACVMNYETFKMLKNAHLI